MRQHSRNASKTTPITVAAGILGAAAVSFGVLADTAEQTSASEVSLQAAGSTMPFFPTNKIDKQRRKEQQEFERLSSVHLSDLMGVRGATSLVRIFDNDREARMKTTAGHLNFTRTARNDLMDTLDLAQTGRRGPKDVNNSIGNLNDAMRNLNAAARAHQTDVTTGKQHVQDLRDRLAVLPPELRQHSVVEEGHAQLTAQKQKERETESSELKRVSDQEVPALQQVLDERQ